jgi:hypothetical protein
MFEMSFDAERALLTVVKTGFWSMNELRQFTGAFLTLDRDIRRKHPRYRIFADCRNYSVQSAEVSKAYTEIFDDLSRDHQGRFAILVPSALARLQAKHAMPHTIVEVFTDEAEAMRWLFDADAPQ